MTRPHPTIAETYATKRATAIKHVPFGVLLADDRAALIKAQPPLAALTGATPGKDEMMTPYQISELHVYARALHQQHLSAGAVFDKSLLRFNDIVAVGVHWTRMGPVTAESFRTAKAGVREAVSACIKVWVLNKGPTIEPMYVAGRGPQAMINLWMESAA